MKLSHFVSIAHTRLSRRRASGSGPGFQEHTGTFTMSEPPWIPNSILATSKPIVCSPNAVPTLTDTYHLNHPKIWIPVEPQLAWLHLHSTPPSTQALMNTIGG